MHAILQMVENNRRDAIYRVSIPDKDNRVSMINNKNDEVLVTDENENLRGSLIENNSEGSMTDNENFVGLLGNGYCGGSTTDKDNFVGLPGRRENREMR